MDGRTDEHLSQLSKLWRCSLQFRGTDVARPNRAWPLNSTYTTDRKRRKGVNILETVEKREARLPAYERGITSGASPCVLKVKKNTLVKSRLQLSGCTTSALTRIMALSPSVYTTCRSVIQNGYHSIRVHIRKQCRLINHRGRNIKK